MNKSILEYQSELVGCLFIFGFVEVFLDTPCINMRSEFSKQIQSFNKHSTIQHIVCCCGRGDYYGEISVVEKRECKVKFVVNAVVLILVGGVR